MSSLSHGQRLAAIEATQEVIDQLTKKISQERALRDSLILDALDAKTPYRTLQRLTGLSRSGLIKIQNSPHNHVPMPEAADA